MVELCIRSEQENLQTPIGVLSNCWCAGPDTAETTPARPATTTRCELIDMVELCVCAKQENLQPPIDIPAYCRCAGPGTAETAPARPATRWELIDMGELSV